MTDYNELQSQLGQAHADLLLAQADAETLRAAVREYTTSATTDDRARLRAELIDLARTDHPGQALADEVRAARAELVLLRELYADVQRWREGDDPRNLSYVLETVEKIEQTEARTE